MTVEGRLVPRGWTTAPIGDLCLLVNGRGFKRSEWTNSGLPIIRIQNLKDADAGFNYFQGSYDEKILIPPGELLFAWSGTPGTSFGAFIWDGPPGVLNQHIFRVLFDERQLDRRFLRHAINERLESLIGAAQGGVGLRHVTKGTLTDTEILLPPTKEQRRIADKLDAVLARVDACRERLGRTSAILKRFRQSVLSSAASGKLTEDVRDESVDPVGERHPAVLEEHGVWPFSEIPSSWKWKPFSAVFIDRTDSKRKLPQKAYEASGQLPVVDQGEKLIGGYTSRVELESRAEQPVLVFGDHTRCVKYVDFPFVQGADGVKVLTTRQELVSTKYAHLMVMCCQLPDKGYSRHMRFLRASWFPIPPPEEQTRIVERVRSLLGQCDTIQARCLAAAEQVQRLGPALLAKAFRGELVPQDPDDEPASVLLERIRAERAASAPKTRRSTGGRRTRTGKKPEVAMLNRSEIDERHLSTILKERGPLTSEALWSASQLGIDDFYDQLKDEEARGFLVEKRSDQAAAVRMLEAAA